jgi:DNA primase
LYDRYRDRLVLPIVADGQVLGFVARRNPKYSDADGKGPKYLNTAATPLFDKGSQLYGLDPELSAAVPVIVEGPLDAIAVTLASAGRHVGVAPLGTSLTRSQAKQLGDFGTTPIVLTDADQAGRKAAARDFWQLAALGVEADFADLTLTGTKDPAELLELGRAERLNKILAFPDRLCDHLLDALTEWNWEKRAFDKSHITEAIQALAASDPENWDDGITLLAERLDVPPTTIEARLAEAIMEFNADPRRYADHGMWVTNRVLNKQREKQPDVISEPLFVAKDALAGQPIERRDVDPKPEESHKTGMSI